MSNANPKRRTVKLSPHHIAHVRHLCRCNGQDKVVALLGVNVSTIDRVLTRGELIPAAAERLAARLDALGAK